VSTVVSPLARAVCVPFGWKPARRPADAPASFAVQAGGFCRSCGCGETGRTVGIPGVRLGVHLFMRLASQLASSGQA